MKRKSKLVLFGGLGNQLFQYATALNLSKNRVISLEANLGHPRVDPAGNIDLLAFDLSDEISITWDSSSDIFSKILSSILKISSVTFTHSFPKRALMFLRSFLRVVFSRYVVFPDGVGFSKTNLVRGTPKYIVGNFHSYKWFDDEVTLTSLQGIRLKITPEWVIEMAIRAEYEMPIIVHVRRGDYTSISELGILKEDYFQTALKKATESYPNSMIWVFSDDLHEAKQILPSLYVDKYYFVRQEPWNSAAHLETMRYGHCFVISNSTFSWWAAFLRHKETAPVYCPDQWFLSKPNPESMIPKDWIRISLR